MSRAWKFNLRDFRRPADPHDMNSIDYLAGRGLNVDTSHNMASTPIASVPWC
jgi:hypothetical protein